MTFFFSIKQSQKIQTKVEKCRYLFDNNVLIW
nr:MAG TPA: hypothetical protein [Caudoviricetes sp.]